MKSTAKHHAAPTANRQGVAALVVGGLVAGTVATAGAVAFTAPEGSQAADGMTGDLAGALDDSAQVDPADAAAALASMRSSSLDELREQGAADRSEARTAPEDAEGVETVLAESGFTGRTVEQAAPVAEEQPAATEETAAAEQQSESAQADPAQAQQSQQSQPAQQEQAQPAQQEQAAQQAQPEQTQQAQPEQTQQAQPAAEPAPVGGGVLGVAASYVGYPYVLMGTPPNSFDCSAYTWWVFQQAGISIPRTVNGQKGAVTPVSNPQPGDLVFYNDWHHVGIYAGNGMTYEALNPSTGVRYGPILSSNIWYGRIG